MSEGSRHLIASTVRISGEFRLAEAVTPAGDISYWLMRDLCACCEDRVEHGDLSRCAHEQQGPLPYVFREHMRWAMQNLCGRTTAAGHSCERIVRERGQACHHHRDREAP